MERERKREKMKIGMEQKNEREKENFELFSLRVLFPFNPSSDA